MATTNPDVESTTDEKPELTLDVKVEVKSTCERHVVVTVPRAEVERYRRDSYDDIVPKAELPGFRAGKAPRKLVESRFKEQVAEQVKSSLVMDSLQKVTSGDYFSAIGEPDFDFEAVQLPEEGDFVYQFRIEVRPDFETPQWEGLKLQRPVCEVTESHLEERLRWTLARFLPGEPVDGACQSGDSVTLNGQFSYEGRNISSFDEEKVVVRQRLCFGDAQVAGFDELICGKHEGESFTTTLKISDSAANEELRGKEVQAQFEIVEIRRVNVDEIGPAELDKLGFESTDELRDFVRTELQQQFGYRQQQSLRKQIVQMLTAGANWELPESLVRSQTNRELQRMILELQRSGISQDDITGYVNMARMNARESTIAALREHFVLEKIAEDLKLEPSEADYDREIGLIAEQSDSTPRRIRARLEKSGQMDALRNQIVERMVIEKVVEAAQLQDQQDTEFFKSLGKDSSDIDFTIAGDFAIIPEAKHDNAPPELPGAAKLPEKDKED
ncbi:MAG: trigger factor [Pirellulaceae bacterium]|nr:trigger factor [Pirellulaceae bacterium]